MRKKGKKRKERKEKTIRKFRNENNPPRGTVSPALYPSLPDSLWLDASPCPSTPTLLSGYFARFNLARLSVSAKLRWRKEPPATRSSCILVVPENHVRPFPTCNEGLQLSVYLRKEDRLPFACHPRTNTEAHEIFISRRSLNTVKQNYRIGDSLEKDRRRVEKHPFYARLILNAKTIHAKNRAKYRRLGISLRSSLVYISISLSIDRTVGWKSWKRSNKREGRRNRGELKRGEREKRGKSIESKRGLENFLRLP